MLFNLSYIYLFTIYFYLDEFVYLSYFISIFIVTLISSHLLLGVHLLFPSAGPGASCVYRSVPPHMVKNTSPKTIHGT